MSSPDAPGESFARLVHARELRHDIDQRLQAVVPALKRGLRHRELERAGGDRVALVVIRVQQALRGGPADHLSQLPAQVHRVLYAEAEAYVKWFIDPEIDEIVAFERGHVSSGKDVVEHGEELATLAPEKAPLHELDWRLPNAEAEATSTPTPGDPGRDVTDADRHADAGARQRRATAGDARLDADGHAGSCCSGVPADPDAARVSGR